MSHQPQAHQALSTKAMFMTQTNRERNDSPRAGSGPGGRPAAPNVIDIAGLERGLRQAVRGEVRFDAASRAMYANDGSNFRQVPIGVVVPQTLDDIVTTHRVCAAQGAPIVNRGGGTSLSGETVNYAVVIDNSKYLTGIGDTDTGRRLLTAEPGVINEELNRATGRSGLVLRAGPGNLATMGPGVPYGIGAKFACPGRPVIVFAGDGAMQMNGLAELITIKRYWPEWADPRLIVAVLHNDDLNQVTWEMRAMEGAPKFTESQTLPSVDYAAFAESLGLQAIHVDKPAEIGPAWEAALAAARPTVLDVRTDPDVPPIPPHATFEQAKNAGKAMLKGDEDRRGVIAEGVKTKTQEFLPHRAQ